MGEYSEKICEERHIRINERLELDERRLNDHSKRIDKLEQRGAAVDVEIKNLCKDIKSLVTTIKWFIGLIVGAFVGFFFYAAQKGLIK